MSVLQMSYSAAILVVVVVMIRFVALNKLPKTMFLVLWGLALFRLFIPFSIPMPAGISNTINNFSGFFLSENNNSLIIGESAFLPEFITGRGGFNGTGFADMRLSENAVTEQGSGINLMMIWFIGMMIMFIIFTILYMKSRKSVSFATAVRDNILITDRIKGFKHIRPISVMQSDRITSPLAVGLIKPRIILPASMDLTNHRRLDYILTHEYFHIKKFDALWKMLLVIAVCVHWYNPLVWVMFILVNRDLELTCDEMVIRHFGIESKPEYAYTIIDMIEKKSKLSLLYSGFSANYNQERIISVMKGKKSSLKSIILSGLIVLIMTFGVLATTACDDVQEEPEKNEYSDSNYDDSVDSVDSDDLSDPGYLGDPGDINNNEITLSEKDQTTIREITKAVISDEERVKTEIISIIIDGSNQAEQSFKLHLDDIHAIEDEIWILLNDQILEIKITLNELEHSLYELNDNITVRIVP